MIGTKLNSTPAALFANGVWILDKVCSRVQIMGAEVAVKFEYGEDPYMASSAEVSRLARDSWPSFDSWLNQLPNVLSPDQRVKLRKALAKMQRHAPPGRTVTRDHEKVIFWTSPDWVREDKFVMRLDWVAELADMSWKKWLKRFIEPLKREEKRRRRWREDRAKQWMRAEKQAALNALAMAADMQASATFNLADSTFHGLMKTYP